MTTSDLHPFGRYWPQFLSRLLPRTPKAMGAPRFNHSITTRLGCLRPWQGLLEIVKQKKVIVKSLSAFGERVR